MSIVRPRTLTHRLALWQGLMLTLILAAFSISVWLIVVAEEEIDAKEVAEMVVARERLMLAFAVALPLALVVTIGGSYVLARRALAPIAQVSALAEEVGAGRLDLRIPEDAGAVDEARRLVTSLNRMIGRLDRSVGGLKRFTADASHELRHPLATSIATLELALRDPAAGARDPAELRAAIAATLDDLRRMTQLADILLTFARADAGALGLQPKRVALGTIVDDVVGTFASSAAERGVTLTRAPGDAEVVVDPMWLSVALTNLVDNACKLAPQGGHVTIIARAHDALACIDVQDDGPGVAPEDRERIFERFYRSGRTRGATTGFGIGLSLARDLVTAQGGTLTLTPTTLGATFSIALPAPSAT